MEAVKVLLDNAVNETSFKDVKKITSKIVKLYTACISSTGSMVLTAGFLMY